jgi:hypothetical protein
MRASRLASDRPAPVVYSCSQEAIPEHTKIRRAAAITGRQGLRTALPTRPCRGIPRYRDDSPRPYNRSMTTTSDHRAASAVLWAGAFLDSLAAQDFAQLGGALAAEALWCSTTGHR